MRLIVAAISFIVTLGVIFALDKFPQNKTDQQLAQIIHSTVGSETIKPAPEDSFTLPPRKDVIATKTVTPQTKTSTPAPPPVSSPVASTFSTPIRTIAPARTSAPTTSPTVTTMAPFFVNTPTPTLTPTPTPLPTIPAQTATPIPAIDFGSIEVVSLTTPVQHGSSASLKILVIPSSACTLKVKLSSGYSSASGLDGERIAGSDGTIAWGWKISSNTKPILANLQIDCVKDGLSFDKSLQMEITD